MCLKNENLYPLWAQILNTLLTLFRRVFRTSFRTPFRTYSERRRIDFMFHLKKLQKEPEILRFQALSWSKWRGLNSRPLAPQFRQQFQVVVQVRHTVRCHDFDIGGFIFTATMKPVPPVWFLYAIVKDKTILRKLSFVTRCGITDSFCLIHALSEIVRYSGRGRQSR